MASLRSSASSMPPSERPALASSRCISLHARGGERVAARAKNGASEPLRALRALRPLSAFALPVYPDWQRMQEATAGALEGWDARRVDSTSDDIVMQSRKTHRSSSGASTEARRSTSSSWLPAVLSPRPSRISTMSSVLISRNCSLMGSASSPPASGPSVPLSARPPST
eukprot:353299-Chlamydomonas_euryale.AAC.22